MKALLWCANWVWQETLRPRFESHDDATYSVVDIGVSGRSRHRRPARPRGRSVLPQPARPARRRGSLRLGNADGFEDSTPELVPVLALARENLSHIEP